MGTGGSRYGAGRPGYRLKAESVQRIDVRDFARRGVLKAGWFSWSWNRGGEPTGSIGVRVHDSYSLALEYRVHDYYADTWHQANQSVRVNYTACTYGGKRPWFACPVCSRRIAVLYLRSSRFACRHCQRVAYRSQSEDALGRMWRKQTKIEKRLGDNWQRPKGMRRRTYEGLLDMLNECEQRRGEACALFIERLFLRYPILQKGANDV
jgi:hypothetical protein